MTMQVAVKWVYQSVKGPQGQSMEAGQKPSLCFRGRLHMLAVAASYPVRVLKRPVRDFDVLRPCAMGNEDYPVARAVAQLREIGAHNGITLGAKRLLEAALVATPNVDEDNFNDEEEMTMETRKEDGAVPAAEEAAVAPAQEEGVAGTAPAASATPKKKRSSKKTAAKTKEAKAEADRKEVRQATANVDARKGATAAKKPPKASPKGKGEKPAKKADKGPSRISRAVEYMLAEVKKAGGQKKLERGWRKELFARAAEKFDLSTITCNIQYNKQVLPNS